MLLEYRTQLCHRIGEVLNANPTSYDHRSDFPLLTGALGDPESGIWFVGENPSLRRVERVRDPSGGPPTEEAQWWESRGDKLFRDMLVKHGFKSGRPEDPGGWQCYITNAIKAADYAQRWRGSSGERKNEAADAWAPVLAWELKQSRPQLVIALGKTVKDILDRLKRRGIEFPRLELVQHYAYVALRPRGRLGPMHPERVREYDEEFARVAVMFRQLRNSPMAAV